MNTLTNTIDALERLAPLELAATWDNVGLLLQAAQPQSSVDRILLTIDLTEPVLADAIAQQANFIMAYHPVIFSGLKSITRQHPQQRILLDAVRHGISVHSLHTALDAVPGGVNDWLISVLGMVTDCQAIEPIESSLYPAPVGMGRVGTLAEPVPLGTVIERVKCGLELQHVRVAIAPEHTGSTPIRRVAVCPGAGGSLFEGLTGVDLLVTGEMRHHDVLARVASGTSVILTEHTNCERGFLKQFAVRLASELGADVAVEVSQVDRDPLRVG